MVDKRGTRKVAQAYLEYLYSPAAQDLAARHFYRPTDAQVAAKYSKQFVKTKLITVDKAVSYTPLDVYKRQSGLCSPGRPG